MPDGGGCEGASASNARIMASIAILPCRSSFTAAEEAAVAEAS